MVYLAVYQLHYKRGDKNKKIEVTGFGGLPTRNATESELGHGTAKTAKESGFDW